MSEMKAAADAAAGASQGAPGPRDTNSPSAVPANGSAPAGSSSLVSGGATSPSVSPAAPIAPAAANGDRAHDWALKYERTANGPEADLVVRTGDINNLGFGWPAGSIRSPGHSPPLH
jgi:hypothetical protein